MALTHEQITQDMIDKILSKHKDLYRPCDVHSTCNTTVESLPIDDIDNVTNTTIDLSDVKYDSKLPIFYVDRINNVVNRRRFKELVIFAIIILTIFFTFDLIKYFKNN